MAASIGVIDVMSYPSQSVNPPIKSGAPHVPSVFFPHDPRVTGFAARSIASASSTPLIVSLSFTILLNVGLSHVFVGYPASVPAIIPFTFGVPGLPPKRALVNCPTRLVSFFAAAVAGSEYPSAFPISASAVSLFTPSASAMLPIAFFPEGEPYVERDPFRCHVREGHGDH